MGQNILGIGAINLDIIFRYKEGDKKLSFYDEFKKDEEDEFDDYRWWKCFYECMQERNLYCSGGGSSANTICAISSLDSNFHTGFLGIIGTDAEADIILEDISWKKIKDYNISYGDRSTNRCLSYIDLDNNRRLAISEGVNDEFKIDITGEQWSALFKWLAKFNWMHISPFKSNTNNQQIAILLEKMADSGLKPTISLDPGTFLSKDGMTAVSINILKYCHYLFLKRSELWALGKPSRSLSSDDSKSINAAEHILEASNNLLEIIEEDIREGKYNIYKNSGKRKEIVSETQYFPGEPIDINLVLDDTGAGDVFNAAYIYGKMNNHSYDKISILAKKMTDIKFKSIGRKDYAKFSYLKNNLEDNNYGSGGFWDRLSKKYKRESVQSWAGWAIETASKILNPSGK